VSLKFLHGEEGAEVSGQECCVIACKLSFVAGLPLMPFMHFRKKNVAPRKILEDNRTRYAAWQNFQGF
jgi:hypothetical protein